MSASRLQRVVVLGLLAACGGTAVIDGVSNGQGGSSSASTTTGGGGGSAAGCKSHDDCPEGRLCVFSSGVCSPACDADPCEDCGPGTICELCATSSCPGCDDCRAACVPITAGRCDGDDACSAGEVCVYTQLLCAPSCQDDVDCGDFAYCEPCATGSCCGCKNCVPACQGGE